MWKNYYDKMLHKKSRILFINKDWNSLYETKHYFCAKQKEPGVGFLPPFSKFSTLLPFLLLL